MELWQFLGTLHPKLVQFPLVLLFVGLLFDAGGLLRNSPRARWAGLVSTGIGTIGLLFAFICGIYAEIWAGRAGVPQHPIELHELAANIASWGFVVLFAWRILLAENSKIEDQKSKIKWLCVYTAVGFFWYTLLILTGYLGGQLVFEYGAGVTGAQSAGILTLHDLNTLATRQTDENLRYSEWMHHVFGFLTLGLSASLLAQAIWPAQRKNLAWVVPTFLIAGGIFLFFKADTDLYALTDMRQWRDREVQLHKTLATIMTVIGIVGMVNVFRARKAPPAPFTSAEIENEKSKIKNDAGSRLVAVLALIGGAMLFTHIHTVAPYANVAAGVYIAHVIMGFVALAIGGARLAQEHFPRWRGALGVVFASLMLVEAGLLVTYNEGLPWFIGYGKYDRWGPGQSPMAVVAPFGDFRAIMLVNQDEGKVFVVFRTPFQPTGGAAEHLGTDEVSLKLDAPPQLLITHGSGELSLTLSKSLPEGAPIEPPATALTGSNFRAEADFLKTTPFVSARLVLLINGERHVGYFDPWVTPRVIPVPPNEVAKFQCPMHEGSRSDEAGNCPVCGMPMIAIKPPLPAGELHDPGYDLKVTLEEGQPFTNKPRSARIAMRLLDNAGKGVPLALTHGQIMHLVVVSEDLNYFDHIHPTQLVGADGPAAPYFIDYAFPRAGTYFLFAETSPVGDRPQSFRIPLYVDDKGVQQSSRISKHEDKLLTVDAGSKFISSIPFPRTPSDSAPLDLAAPTPLFPIPNMPTMGPLVMAKPQPVLAELLTQPRTLYAGLHAQLRFRLSDYQGRPLTDLEPYLLASGHCIAVSEDTNTFIHAHPEDVMGTPADWRGGPTINFGITFPKAGHYRIWAQFHRADQLIIVPVTVDVKDPPAPAGLIRFLLNE